MVKELAHKVFCSERKLKVRKTSFAAVRDQQSYVCVSLTSLNSHCTLPVKKTRVQIHKKKQCALQEKDRVIFCCRNQRTIPALKIPIQRFTLEHIPSKQDARASMKI
jgi:hypothetical protein